MRERIPVDTIIINGAVLTMNPNREIFSNGAVAIHNDRIADVGTNLAIQDKYKGLRIIDAGGGVVQPGFVDAHIHLAQHLGRGSIPDHWPDEKEHYQWLPYWLNLTEEDAECSAMLACLEMVRNGTTAFCSSGSKYEGRTTVNAAERVGLRGVTGIICWDKPPHENVSTGDADKNLERLEAHIKAFPVAEDSLIWATVGMAGMGGCSDRLLSEGKKLADKYNTIMDMHSSFGISDTEAGTTLYGKPAVLHFADIGILGANLQLVHMNCVQEEELPPLRDSRTNIVHCPAASLRMGMGTSKRSKFPEMVNSGINVALGSDSGNYSDYFDVGRQAYLAATIHREYREEMPTISAAQAIEMATIHGARTIGMDKLIGSFEPGKKADVVIHDYCRAEWRPGFDLPNSLIYSAQSTAVDTVLVNGEIILERGKFTRVNDEEEFRRIDSAARSLYKRMGVDFDYPWPVID